MRDYADLIKRLNEFSTEHEMHGGITAEAADAIEELQKVLDAVNDAHNEGYDVGYWAGQRDYEPKWIPVTEQLPEEEETVLVARKFLGIKECPACTYVETAERIGDGWVSYSDEYKIARSKHTDPTHWMPMPEPPMMDEGDTNG